LASLAYGMTKTFEGGSGVGYPILRNSLGLPLMVLPSLPIIIVAFLIVLLTKGLEEQMVYCEETSDTDKKPPAKAVIFPDPQTAIDALLDDWLPRLIESNEILTAALIRVKGLCAAGSSCVIAQRVQADVEAALERAARVNKAF
jgi:hypothetical protein